tara:strand:- start:2678 stop:3910 length:1233 start_codon:yes stop_codon:yes gene_type:complete
MSWSEDFGSNYSVSEDKQLTLDSLSTYKIKNSNNQDLLTLSESTGSLTVGGDFTVSGWIDSCKFQNLGSDALFRMGSNRSFKISKQGGNSDSLNGSISSDGQLDLKGGIVLNSNSTSGSGTEYKFTSSGVINAVDTTLTGAFVGVSGQFSAALAANNITSSTFFKGPEVKAVGSSLKLTSNSSPVEVELSAGNGFHVQKDDGTHWLEVGATETNINSGKLFVNSGELKLGGNVKSSIEVKDNDSHAMSIVHELSGGSTNHLASFNSGGSYAGMQLYHDLAGAGAPCFKTFGQATQPGNWSDANFCGIVLGEGSVAGTPSIINAKITATGGANRTITRQNYIKIADISTPTESGYSTTITDGCVFQFDEDAGTHCAVDAGTNHASIISPEAWIKVNINGTVHYLPAYNSKT